MRTLGVAAAVLAGCGFSASTGGDDEPTCGFVAGAYIDPCTVVPPAGTNLQDLTLTGSSAVDTGNGEIQGPNVATPPPSAIVDGVRIIWVASLTIQETGTLRAYGDSPLAIIATGAI